MGSPCECVEGGSSGSGETMEHVQWSGAWGTQPMRSNWELLPGLQVSANVPPSPGGLPGYTLCHLPKCPLCALNLPPGYIQD